MRICKNSKCDKSIEHLPLNHKYCSLGHAQKHNSEAYCKANKKLRCCVNCKKKYDYMKRDRKQTCSDECEMKIKTKKKVKVKSECQRCGIIVPKTRYYCDRCEVINREVMIFKESMRG